MNRFYRAIFWRSDNEKNTSLLSFWKQLSWDSFYSLQLWIWHPLKGLYNVAAPSSPGRVPSATRQRLIQLLIVPLIDLGISTQIPPPKKKQWVSLFTARASPYVLPEKVKGSTNIAPSPSLVPSPWGWQFFLFCLVFMFVYIFGFIGLVILWSPGAFNPEGGVSVCVRPIMGVWQTRVHLPIVGFFWNLE